MVIRIINRKPFPETLRKLYVVLTLHSETGWWPDTPEPDRWVGPYIDDIADFDRPVQGDVYRGLMDLFEAHGARGTFLMFPWLAENHPEYLQEIVDRGHEVGVHTHNAWQEMTAEDARAAFIESRAAVAAVIGEERTRSLAIGPAPIMPDQIEISRKALSATEGVFEFTLDHFSPWRADHGLDVYVYRPSIYFPFNDEPEPLANQVHLPEIMATGMRSGQLPVMSDMGGSFLWTGQIRQLMERVEYLADIAGGSPQPVNFQRVTHTEELCTETSLIKQNFENFDTVLDFIDNLVETGRAEYVTAAELGELATPFT